MSFQSRANSQIPGVRYVLKKTGLVVFDGEVVMSLTLPDLLSKSVGPIGDGQVAAHATQGCAGGNGQNRGESMASALGAASVWDFSKKVGQGLHLLGTKHDF